MAQPTVDYIWKNGKLEKWDDARVHVLTHALHYGSGVFEGIRCYKTADGPAVFRLPEHMQRLKDSAKMLYMDFDYSVDELCEIVKDTIKANKIDECYIRPLVFRGYGAMGLDPIPAPVEFVVAVWPWPAYLGEDSLTQGVDVGVSSWRQRSINALPPAIKAVGNYLNSSFARMEANRHGYNEAIMLNETGLVAEGTGENLFVIKDETLMTPPVSDGLLPGITRDCVMDIARDFGYEAIECSLVRTDIYTADEFFMTGTAAELVPVRACDGIEIGEGVAGPITLKLQRTFFDAVRGKDEAYKHWLTYV
jgi:branched-chain amino acid aminotransferase